MALARHLHIALLLAQSAALPALGVIGYCHIRPLVERRLRPRAELLLLGVVFGILGASSVLGSIDAGDGAPSATAAAPLSASRASLWM